jgi:hypothetical protein
MQDSFGKIKSTQFPSVCCGNICGMSLEMTSKSIVMAIFHKNKNKRKRKTHCSDKNKNRNEMMSNALSEVVHFFTLHLIYHGSRLPLLKKKIKFTCEYER